MDLQAQAQGQDVSEWTMNRSEEMNDLIKCNWFHVEKLGVEVEGDGQLRMQEGFISRIPEEENTEKLQSASDFIAEFLEHSERMEPNIPSQEESDKLDTRDFLVYQQAVRVWCKYQMKSQN